MWWWLWGLCQVSECWIKHHCYWVTSRDWLLWQTPPSFTPSNCFLDGIVFLQSRAPKSKCQPFCQTVTFATDNKANKRNDEKHQDVNEKLMTPRPNLTLALIISKHMPCTDSTGKSLGQLFFFLVQMFLCIPIIIIILWLYSNKMEGGATVKVLRRNCVWFCRISKA